MHVFSIVSRVNFSTPRYSPSPSTIDVFSTVSRVAGYWLYIDVYLLSLKLQQSSTDRYLKIRVISTFSCFEQDSYPSPGNFTSFFSSISLLHMRNLFAFKYYGIKKNSNSSKKIKKMLGLLFFFFWSKCWDFYFVKIWSCPIDKYLI